MLEPISHSAEILTPLVERILLIEDVTMGHAEVGFAARYRGKLRKDSIEAYDELAKAVAPLRLTPVFRVEDERHVVLLMDGLIEPRPSNVWVNIVLAIVTAASLLLAGAVYDFEGPAPADTLGLLGAVLPHLLSGLPFALSMASILGAHEFGHYLAARYHKTAVSLPYFLPMPFSPLGTLGAFIQLKAPPRNLRVLHDIGVAGPLAGLIVTIPILIYGLMTSDVGPIPSVIAPGQGFSFEGNSLFYLGLKYILHGEWLPAPASFRGLPPLVYWLRYFLTGIPAPLGGHDVLLNQVAWAGWAGLLITMLNLIPAGQLDGGHALYVLFGKNAAKAMPFILVTLALLGFVWQGWWLWAVLIYWFGRSHAEPLDQITQLDTGRTLVAAFVLLIFLLIFMPVPLRLIVG